MKYYDTSLALLKNMVKERDVNAVLGYMEQKTEVPMFSYIMSPIVSKKDSAAVMLPVNASVQMSDRNLTKLQSRRVC